MANEGETAQKPDSDISGRALLSLTLTDLEVVLPNAAATAARGRLSGNGRLKEQHWTDPRVVLGDGDRELSEMPVGFDFWLGAASGAGTDSPLGSLTTYGEKLQPDGIVLDLSLTPDQFAQLRDSPDQVSILIQVTGLQRQKTVRTMVWMGSDLSALAVIACVLRLQIKMPPHADDVAPPPPTGTSQFEAVERHLADLKTYARWLVILCGGFALAAVAKMF